VVSIVKKLLYFLFGISFLVSTAMYFLNGFQVPKTFRIVSMTLASVPPMISAMQKIVIKMIWKVKEESHGAMAYFQS